ncbi:streptophobe family protein [Lentzea sp. HUAS TT2]|uniref:streptophobe family protein n=1 Tax=Lentzea sp. HUAS TT2 TaxID=3447454 RepID=UPI003F70CBE8
MAVRRDVGRGVTAGVAALAAMAGVAAAGLLLLDAGRVGGFGRLTAAVVAMAVGGSAEFGAAPGDARFAVRGGVEVVPSGVALAGAVVLGWLLLRHRDGLLVRGGAAATTFTAGAVAIALTARGTVTPPRGATGGLSGICGLPSASPLGRVGSVDSLGLGFSVPVGPVVAGAVCWVLAVVGVCRLVARFEISLRAPLWTVGALVAASLLLAWVLGAPAVAGGMLLLLPSVVFGVVSLGLGVPWTVESGGVLTCALDGVAPPAPGGWLTGVALVVLLALGVVTGLAIGRGDRPLVRAACGGAVLGVSLGVLAWVSRPAARLGVEAFAFSVPVLEVRAAASLVGAVLLGGAAGVSGGLLVAGALRLTSVPWPAWRDRVR